MFFFKGYVCKYLLGFKVFSYCPGCSKVCLEEGEIKKNYDFRACCETCDLWFHWKCVAVINQIYFSSILFIMLYRDGWMTGWRDGLRIIDFSH